uniref:aminotransferase class IV n=1 Tax=Candidatus Planktophila sp. TaxID=2175601 RepID=UPI0040497995
MKVVYNGDLLEQKQSPCNEKGWLSGEGIFETIKTVDSKPWAFSRHMRRALSSAAIAGVTIPKEEDLRTGVELLLSEQIHDRGLLRLSFSNNGNWVAVHLAYPELVGAAKLVVHSQRIPSAGSQVKKFPYDHRLSILKSAQSMGFDEAVVLNENNKISEAAVSNLLMKINGQWITPPLTDGALPGVVRALVLENCDVSVRSIDIAEMHEIESAFLIGSLRVAQSIDSIDSKTLVQSSDFKREIQAMALRTSVG